MMLPHGYEGQGPEHSSARLERFLQLCADNNMQVVQPTTAAQIFHLLRRQMIRLFRKPLVIMTPKSLLRNKDAGSPLADLAKGSFQTVIGEVDEKIDAEKVKRVIACSGKVYYDLVNARKERGQTDTAIIRVEQLYPFPHKAFAAELKKFPSATPKWCGRRTSRRTRVHGSRSSTTSSRTSTMDSKLAYAGRPASASPAVGYYDKHYAQQKALLDTAFSKLKGFVLTK